MLGFSTAARKLAPRDRVIGWTQQQREKALALVVDNPHLLIPPGSHPQPRLPHPLARARPTAQELVRALQHHLVLIETFVETPRFTGALYKARAGPASAPPRATATTTATSSSPNPERTSGSAPSANTGGELSTGDIMILITW